MPLKPKREYHFSGNYRSLYSIDKRGKRRFCDSSYHKPSRSIGKRYPNFPPPPK